MVVWLLAYLALGALALPATAALLRSFPDRGAGFAVPVAFAVVGVVGFWVGQVTFGLLTLVVALLVLAALSAVALWRGATPDRRRYAETMGVFTVAFLLLVAVRALDPAVHPGGGEKFLDFGMLTALARAGALPPEDFWFAGERVQYYYGGHMIAALLARLTGTAPRFAYNLALPGFYAAFVTAAYSLAGAVAADRGRSRVSAGVFAAVLVGLASNLATPLRALAWWVGDGTVLWVTGLDAAWAVDGPATFSYWPASRVIEGTINEFPLFAYLNGDLHAHMMSPPLTLLVAAVGYAYWHTPATDLRRRRLLVLATAPLAGLVAFVNTWSFPTTLGVTWLALALAPADPRHLVPRVGPPPSPESDDGGLSAVGPDDGALRAGLARLVDELGRTATALVLTGVVAALAAATVLPFLIGATGGRRGIGLLTAENRSRLLGLLVVHGVFLAIAGRFLGGQVVAGLGRRSRTGVAAVGVGLGVVVLAALVTLVGPLVGVQPRVLGAVPFVLLIAVGWVLVRGESTVGGPAEADADTETAGRDGTAGAGYETALLVGAAGLVTLVEFVYVTETGPGRFNTVFKVYAQVWALSAVAGGALLAEYADPAALARRVSLTTPRTSTRPTTDGGPEATPDSDPDTGPASPASGPAESGTDEGSGGALGAVTVGGVLVAVLLVTASLYAGLALTEHAVDVRNEPATLDAVRFAERYHATEWPAIEYVRGLEGTPTLVTAPAERIYQWSNDGQVRQDDPPELVGGAAPSSLSGVPTLAGWGVEVVYRGQAAWDERVAAVEGVYTAAPAEQARLLAEYDVAYVYVGPTERQRYGDVRLDERLTGVSVVPESRDWEFVTLYRVDPDEVGVAPDWSGESTEENGPDGVS